MKSQQQGANESGSQLGDFSLLAEVKLCWALDSLSIIKLTSPWGMAGPRRATPPELSPALLPSGLCAFFKEKQRLSGPLNSLFFSPSFLAASFGKEMFCSQEVHCESILHPRHKLAAASLDSSARGLGEGCNLGGSAA